MFDQSGNKRQVVRVDNLFDKSKRNSKKSQEKTVTLFDIDGAIKKQDLTLKNFFSGNSKPKKLTKEGLIFSKGQLISKKRENTLFSSSGRKKADVKLVSVFNQPSTPSSGPPNSETSLTTTLFDSKGRKKTISTKKNVFSDGKLISHKKSERDLTKENALNDLFSRPKTTNTTGKKIDISGLKIFGGPAKTTVTKTSSKIGKGFWSGKTKSKTTKISNPKFKGGIFGGKKTIKTKGTQKVSGSQTVTVKAKDL